MSSEHDIDSDVAIGGFTEFVCEPTDTIGTIADGLLDEFTHCPFCGADISGELNA